MQKDSVVSKNSVFAAHAISEIGKQNKVNQWQLSGASENNPSDISQEMLKKTKDYHNKRSEKLIINLKEQLFSQSGKKVADHDSAQLECTHEIETSGNNPYDVDY